LRRDVRASPDSHRLGRSKKTKGSRVLEKKRPKIAPQPLHSERPSAFRRVARRFGGKRFSVNDTETAPKKQETF